MNDMMTQMMVQSTALWAGAVVADIAFVMDMAVEAIRACVAKTKNTLDGQLLKAIQAEIDKRLNVN